MAHRSLEAAFSNFLTADSRPQTAVLEKDRRPRSAVGGQIYEGYLNRTKRNHNE
jgi:hypothetical protein